MLHPGGAAAQAQPQVETQLVLNNNSKRVTRSRAANLGWGGNKVWLLWKCHSG